MSNDVVATAAAPPGFTSTTGTTSASVVEWGNTPTPSSADAKDDFFLNHHHIHQSSADNRNVNRSYHGTSTFTILDTAGSGDNRTNGTGSGALLDTDDRQGYPSFFQPDDDDDAIIGSQLLESMTNCFQTNTNDDTIKNNICNDSVNRDHNNNNNSGDSKVIRSSSQSNALPTRTPNSDKDIAALPTPVAPNRPDDRNGVLESLLLPTSSATTSSNSTNYQNDDSLSYHRMKRHLANRLIGTTTTTTTTTSTGINSSTTTGTTNTPAVHANNSNNHHLMEAALNSSTALTSAMAFENLKREHQQQTLPPPSPLNYDNQAMLHSDTSFYHHISSNESAISAPSKIMHDDEKSNGPSNDNPRLFTTWSSFGSPVAAAATTSSLVEPRSTTPVQLYAGQQSAIGQPSRSLPRTKDIGMNVTEPKNDEDDKNVSAPANVIQSHRFHATTTTTTHAANMNNNSHDTTTTMGTTGTTATTTNQSNHNPTDGTITSDTSHTSGLRSSLQELERGIQNLWSPDAHEFHPQTSASVVPPATTNHHHNMASFASQDHHVPQPTSPASSNFYNNNNNNRSHHPHHQHPTNAPFLHSLPSNFISGGGGGGPPSGNSSISDPVTTYSSGDMSPLQVEIDLQPYCWDSTLSSKYGVSRTLVLMHVSQHYIRISDVRNACETFGVLESFRADFVTKFGIYFISYYDIRSAQYASLELQSILQRISVMSRSNEEVVVQYCLSLNSSSQYDESQIVINNLPTSHHHHMNESTIMSMLSSYGAVRTMQFLSNDGSSGTSSCLVEFQNVQDTKQALLELDNSQPFIGTGGMFASNNVITVQVKPRDENERRLGRDLLALLSRWRHNNNQNNGVGLQQQQLHHRGIVPNTSSTSSGVQQHSLSAYNMTNVNGNHSVPSNIGSSPYKLNSSGIVDGDGLGYGNAVGGRNTNTADPWYRDSMNDPLLVGQQQSVPQYVLGADGRFTPSHVPKAVNNAQYDFGATANHNMIDRHQQQYHSHQRLNGGQLYPQHQQSSLNHQSLNNRYSSDRSLSPHQQTSQQHHNDRSRSHHDTRSINNNGILGSHNTPYYAHTITPTDTNSVLGRSLRSGSGHSHMTPGGHSHGTSIGNASGMDNNLTMDLDLVEIGQDTRTSLMVRNIPNKYTQQMLLSEFDSNGHGPGIIDFFYLPIDFKNRCNRGYAFINFVNCKDILGFHRRYFGKHWRTFNSDKICDITYARIQGKDAMLKRFENSALMEKDDEYKPLVFASDGPNRGTRLPFPDPMNLQQMNHHTQQQHGNHHLHSQPQSHRHQNTYRHTNPTFNTTSSTSSMDGRTEM